MRWAEERGGKEGGGRTRRGRPTGGVGSRRASAGPCPAGASARCPSSPPARRRAGGGARTGGRRRRRGGACRGRWRRAGRRRRAPPGSRSPRCPSRTPADPPRAGSGDRGGVRGRGGGRTWGERRRRRPLRHLGERLAHARIRRGGGTGRGHGLHLEQQLHPVERRGGGACDHTGQPARGRHAAAVQHRVQPGGERGRGSGCAGQLRSWQAAQHVGGCRHAAGCKRRRKRVEGQLSAAVCRSWLAEVQLLRGPPPPWSVNESSGERTARTRGRPVMASSAARAPLRKVRKVRRLIVA